MLRFVINEIVKTTKGIWDDGEDHHPPGWLAFKGDILVVRKVRENALVVSHPGVLDSAFTVYPEEVAHLLTVVK